MGDILSSETADEAARFLLSFVNTTTTISASYALVIILGISFVLLVVLGLVYLAASAIFTGGVGKRSLPDGEDSEIDYKWARILEILDHMEEHFRRLGAQKSDEECRKKLICKLAEKGNKNQDENAKKLLKYASEMSDLYEKRSQDGDRPELRAAQTKAAGFRQAVVQGRKYGNCETAYPKCSS